MAAKERVENVRDGYKKKNKLLFFASLWQLGRTSKDLFASSRKHFLHTHSIVEIVPIPIYFPPQPQRGAVVSTTSSLLLLFSLFFDRKNNSLTKLSSFTLFTLPFHSLTRRHHGSHQANSPQIHRRQGPPQAGKTTTTTTTEVEPWPVALRRRRPPVVAL